MRQWIRAFGIAAVGGAMVAGSGCGRAAKPQAKEKKPSRIEVATVGTMRLVERLETTGDVVAVNTVMVQATVEGPILFCPWREGDRIEKAGQKLVEIDRPLYRQAVAADVATLAVAKAKLADLEAGTRPEEIAQARETVRQLESGTQFANSDLDRIKALAASGSVPAESAEQAAVNYVKWQTQLQAAKEQLAMLVAGPTATEIAVQKALVGQAEAKLALERAKLEECVLRAPFAGIVTEVLVRPGDLATPRAPLLKMLDPSSLVVRAGLPESSAASLRAGTPAEVRLDAFPGRAFAGRIERVHPRIEWDSRTRFVEVRVTEDAELIPRMFARLSVEGRVIEDATVVPDSALVTTPRGQKVVFVVSEGKAAMRQVVTGIEQEGLVQVVEGLRPGETVVVTGNMNLKDGALVTTGAKKTPEASAGTGQGGGK